MMMLIKNTEVRFGVGAIFLHWLMAVLIIGMLALGLYMTGLPVGVFKLKLYGIHKEFGVLILMLALLRIFWRLSNITPSLNSFPPWEKSAALLVHFAFYGFMVGIPLSGWFMSSAAGIPPSFFGLFTLPNLIAPDHEIVVFFKQTHKWLAYGLIATLCLHIAAALKHQFVDKDDIFRRMLP
jgi:cytochrome b561